MDDCTPGSESLSKDEPISRKIAEPRSNDLSGGKDRPDDKKSREIPSESLKNMAFSAFFASEAETMQ